MENKDINEIHQSNRNAWNEAAISYHKDLAEAISFLKKGGMNFCAPEHKYLKELATTCKKAIHLQCAGGTDTLSLLNLGIKEVIGVDISEDMITVAKKKSKALGTSTAQWVQADILQLPEELQGTADLVYSGKGAINWIMDIRLWAKSIASLLKPGGKFYLFEGHPVAYFFDMHSSTLKLDPDFEGYFSKKVYESQDWPETYVGKIKESIEEQANKYERSWPIFEIINALLAAGLTLKKFEEHPHEYWKEFPHLSVKDRESFPNTFSLLVEKP